MKRTCLLSKSYSGAPMMLAGREIIYSPLANEIVRELGSAFFNGNSERDQTDFAGMCEGIMVMWHLAENEMGAIQSLRAMEPSERAKSVLDFMIEHEAGIDQLKGEILTRIKSAMAASVESEGSGKPHLPALDSSQ